MDTFLSVLFLSLSKGAIYGVVAFGLVMVWRGSGILNFAQMGQAMFTTYIASNLIINGQSYWIAAIIAIVLGGLLGATIQQLVMRPIEAMSSKSKTSDIEAIFAIVPIVATLGLLALFQSVAGMIWAGEERGFPAPVSTFGIVVGEDILPFSAFDIFTIGVLAVILVITVLFFRMTNMGLAMRAAALSPEVARLNGVRVDRVKTLGWVISGALASLAGVLVTPTANLSPNTLDLVLIIGFTAAVIGGIESLPGAILGGVIIGTLVNVISVYIDPENVFVSILIVLFLVLLVRPQGILGTKAGRLA